MIGKLTNHALVERPRLGAAKLLVTLGHADERLCRQRAVGAGQSHDLSIKLDGATQIALDLLLVLRRLELDLSRARGLSHHQHAHAECDQDDGNRYLVLHDVPP